MNNLKLSLNKIDNYTKGEFSTQITSNKNLSKYFYSLIQEIFLNFFIDKQKRESCSFCSSKLKTISSKKLFELSVLPRKNFLCELSKIKNYKNEKESYSIIETEDMFWIVNNFRFKKTKIKNEKFIPSWSDDPDSTIKNIDIINNIIRISRSNTSENNNNFYYEFFRKKNFTVNREEFSNNFLINSVNKNYLNIVFEINNLIRSNEPSLLMKNLLQSLQLFSLSDKLIYVLGIFKKVDKEIHFFKLFKNDAYVVQTKNFQIEENLISNNIHIPPIVLFLNNQEYPVSKHYAHNFVFGFFYPLQFDFSKYVEFFNLKKSTNQIEFYKDIVVNCIKNKNSTTNILFQNYNFNFFYNDLENILKQHKIKYIHLYHHKNSNFIKNINTKNTKKVKNIFTILSKELHLHENTINDLLQISFEELQVKLYNNNQERNYQIFISNYHKNFNNKQSLTESKNIFILNEKLKSILQNNKNEKKLFFDFMNAFSQNTFYFIENCQQNFFENLFADFNIYSINKNSRFLPCSVNIFNNLGFHCTFTIDNQEHTIESFFNNIEKEKAARFILLFCA